jgi:hypothetical protein
MNRGRRARTGSVAATTMLPASMRRPQLIIGAARPGSEGRPGRGPGYVGPSARRAEFAEGGRGGRGRARRRWRRRSRRPAHPARRGRAGHHRARRRGGRGKGAGASSCPVSTSPRACAPGAPRAPIRRAAAEVHRREQAAEGQGHAPAGLERWLRRTGSCHPRSRLTQPAPGVVASRGFMSPDAERHHGRLARLHAGRAAAPLAGHPLGRGAGARRRSCSRRSGRWPRPPASGAATTTQRRRRPSPSCARPGCRGPRRASGTWCRGGTAPSRWMRVRWRRGPRASPCLSRCRTCAWSCSLGARRSGPRPNCAAEGSWCSRPCTRRRKTMHSRRSGGARSQPRSLRVVAASTIKFSPPLCSDELRRAADAFPDLGDLAAGARRIVAGSLL